MTGWRGVLGTAVDPAPVREQADVRLYLFCPECGEREFGPSDKGQERPTA